MSDAVEVPFMPAIALGPSGSTGSKPRRRWNTSAVRVARCGGAIVYEAPRAEKSTPATPSRAPIAVSTSLSFGRADDAPEKPGAVWNYS